MKRYITILALLLLFVIPVAVWAAEGETQAMQIYTVDDLLAIADNPKGSYILMSDLDMTGVEWSCPDFSGSFDGNGHAILNLSVDRTGENTAVSYDGNQKTYDTYFAGFFGRLQNAEVKNLNLVNYRALVSADTPCFLGSIAGYIMDSSITECSVSGTMELRAHKKMFGVGGIVGYGRGTIDSCKADVTLICTDTDPDTKDEEFLGGVYATGFIHVLNTQVVLDGYCSDYGYVHNGGITGMYMQDPLGRNRFGKITGNSVTGKITFFECNTDRRAYCKAIVGETLANWYDISDNTDDFVRDERKEYDKELRPEMCEQPVYTETVVPSGCSSYGYTSYCCDGCGYTYTDHYTMFTHTVTVWSLLQSPTTEEEGISQGSCDACGMILQRSEPKLEPVPTQPATLPTQEETEPTQQTQPAGEDAPETEEPTAVPFGVFLAVGVAVPVLTFILWRLLFRKKRGGKYLTRK